VSRIGHDFPFGFVELRAVEFVVPGEFPCFGLEGGRKDVALLRKCWLIGKHRNQNSENGSIGVDRRVRIVAVGAADVHGQSR
jgi:hypothetical protein